MDKAQIKEALELLDPEKDEHWTADGLPRMDIVESLVGDKSITREDVTNADPEFCRDRAKITSTETVAEKRQEATDVLQDIVPEEPAPVTKQSVDEQIQALQGQIDVLTRSRDKLARLRDKLQEAEYGDNSPKADTEARLRYIASQNELRAKRVAKAKEISQLVGQQIAAGSQLDQAMSRKTARGQNRPAVRPVQTKEE